MPTTHSHIRHAGALSNLLALALLTLPLPTHASSTASGISQVSAHSTAQSEPSHLRVSRPSAALNPGTMRALFESALKR